MIFNGFLFLFFSENILSKHVEKIQLIFKRAFILYQEKGLVPQIGGQRSYEVFFAHYFTEKYFIMCLRSTNLCKTHFYVDFNFLFEIMVNVEITNDNVFKLIEYHTNFISKHSLNANYTNFSWLKFHLPVFSINWILQLVYTKYVQP